MLRRSDRPGDAFFFVGQGCSLLDRLPFGDGGDADLFFFDLDHGFAAGRCQGGSRSQRTEVQTVQIVGVGNRTSGRKVNSEKLLCQRLGRRLAAGTWRIRLVHNQKIYPLNP